MQEVIKHIIGILVLGLGFFIGSYLARITKEELNSGQIWFKILVSLSLIGAVMSIFFRNDAYLYSFLFIAIVTSRSLRE